MEGGTSLMFCSAHAKQGMMSVRHQQCLNAQYKKQPIYDVNDGNKQVRTCVQHTKQGVVLSKKCGLLGCIMQPYFGFAGTKCNKFCALTPRKACSPSDEGNADTWAVTSALLSA